MSAFAGLNLKLQAANLQINQLTQNLNCLQDKYSRIQLLHPEFNFDKEIEKEYKDTALEIDKQLADVVLTAANKENIAFFSDAITLYEQTIPEVKKYIRTNMEKVIMLYSESLAMKEEFELQEQEKRNRKVANIFYVKAIC